MRQKSERHRDAADRTVKDIRRKTRKRYSSEDKIRIALCRLALIIEKKQQKSRLACTASSFGDCAAAHPALGQQLERTHAIFY
ncbi:hypothetical protein LP7551_01841 [Roseibium album]|nr:hypothetical protein LP7551_01841 [Roseibium album]